MNRNLDDIPSPARRQQAADLLRLQAQVVEGVERILQAARAGVEIDRDYLNAEPLPHRWLTALEYLTQIDMVTSPAWPDPAAWFDGTIVTAATVSEGCLRIECVLSLVTGSDEWLYTPARYELRRGPEVSTVAFGGTEFARSDFKTHLLERPDRIEDWPWASEFVLGRGILPCPCCDYLTFRGDTPDDPDLPEARCPVCGWISNYIQNTNPECSGMPNVPSLKGARANFREHGAANPGDHEVRPPRPDEIP